MPTHDLTVFLSQLREGFKKLPDPRRGQGQRYRLEALLMLLLLGFLRNARTVQEILERASYDREVLAFLNWQRVPAQGTYTNLFEQMDLEPINQVLRQVGMEFGWSSRHLAIDGKTIKGSLRHEKRLHVVNVATPEGICLSQAASDPAGGEIRSALRQLRALDLAGKVVSGDALFAQKELCRAIKKKEGTGSSN